MWAISAVSTPSLSSLVCFTDPLSLSFHPRSPCLQLQNKSYPKLLLPPSQALSFSDWVELTQFPRTAIFHRQYNEPQNSEIELRQQPLISDSVAQYFGVDDGSIRARIGWFWSGQMNFELLNYNDFKKGLSVPCECMGWVGDPRSWSLSVSVQSYQCLYQASSMRGRHDLTKFGSPEPGLASL